MFRTVFLFEIGYRLRSWSTWVCIAILTLLVYRDTLSGNWDDLIAGGRVARNSPYALYFLFMYYTFWTATLGGGLVIQSILRDFQSRSAETIYSYRVGSRSYFWGKYLAALTILVLVAGAVVLGFCTLPLVATSLGIRPAADFMPLSWPHVVSGFLLLTLPGCFFFGTVFFALAALTGRPGPAYTAIVVFIGVFMAIGVTFGEGVPFAAMQIVDPFAKQTLEGQLLYWTVDERMHGFLQLEGNMLWNRALYIGAATLVLAFALARFDLRKLLAAQKLRSSRPHKEKSEPLCDPARASALHQGLTRTAVSLIAANFVRVTLATGWQEFVLTTREASFRIAYGAVFLLTAAAAWGLASFHTVPDGALLPVSSELLHRASIVPILLCMVGTSYYAAEIVLRERAARIAPLIDACPAPTWTLMLAKLIGAVLVALLFAVIPSIATVGIQLSQGFLELNPGLLAQATLLWAAPVMMGYALVAVVCAGLFPVRGAAQGVAILMGITPFTLQETRVLEHHLALWGVPFPVTLSDFDANAEFLLRGGLFALYWLSLYGFLCVIAYWVWPRGAGSAVSRFMRIPSRMTPVSSLVAGCCLVVCVLAASHIHSVVNVRNAYQSVSQVKQERAEYERTLSAKRVQAQPRIENAHLSIDFFPSQRRVTWKAQLDIRNPSDVAITELQLEPLEHSTISTVAINGGTLAEMEGRTTAQSLGHFVYPLAESLAPAEAAQLVLTGGVHYEGFANEGRHGTLTRGASYVSSDLWPRFGYQRARELSRGSDRRIEGLRQRTPLPVAAAAVSVAHLSVSDDADFLPFTMTLTTDPDQIALAPGDLISDVREAGRRTFVYRTGSRQVWNPHAVSGRYEARRASGVELYFNPAHAWNVDRFVDSARDAIALGSKLWGAYPHAVLRIAEAPRDTVEGVATSGNLIVIAEDRGWLHDYRKPVPFDFIAYGVAREVSRAWWGESVQPADTQGAVLLTEGIPALHGLMALEDRGGSAAAARYVDVLAERYLRARAKEDETEVAVMSFDSQPYAADRAALAMYQIYRVLGRDRFTQVLSVYFTENRERIEPPFASVQMLANALTQAAQSGIEREIVRAALYETMVHDFQVREAVAQPMPNGEFRLMVRLDVAPQIRGVVKVAAYEGDGSRLLQEWDVVFRDGTATSERVLARRPLRIKVDPDRLRIDRNLGDNDREVRFIP